MPDFVFGRLINRPWPFTRISVLSMLIKCRSRSTFGQVRASASPIRQPVPSRKRTRSGKSAWCANSLRSRIISHARHSSSVSARASCVDGRSSASTSRTGLWRIASRRTANAQIPDVTDRQSLATEYPAARRRSRMNRSIRAEVNSDSRSPPSPGKTWRRSAWR
jgi:hypothetical protein